jgi:beta-glucosidase
LQAITNKVGAANVFYESEDPLNAAALAQKVDVAVVAVGEPAYVHTSTWGPGQLSIEDNQLDVIKSIHATGTPTIVVLLMGRPYVVPWCAENVSAMLAAYYPGTRGGEAIADVLFGDFNPKGKLPFQMPRSMEQVLKQKEDVPGDIENPLYPFGHGLSYQQAPAANQSRP